MTLIYVTKYALTRGVFTVEAEVNSAKTVAWWRRPSSGFREYVHGNDFQFNAEEALAQAEEMRIKKLQSLDKQTKKISALKFEIKQ